MPIVYKTTIAANRCFCNLIFAYRYKTINRRNSLFAANKAYWFSIVIIVLSVLQTIFDCVSFSIYQIDTPNCFNLSLKVGTYIYSTCSYYLLLAICQTVILVEIVKPISNHCMRMNNTTIPNDEIKSNFLQSCFHNFCVLLERFWRLNYILYQGLLLKDEVADAFRRQSQHKHHLFNVLL